MRDEPTYKIEIVEGLVQAAARDRRELGTTDVVVALGRPHEVAEPERRAMLCQLLSDDEKQRLERFHFERDRVLFLVAHALLRIALSRHANIDPRAWQFRASAYGRPEIIDSRSRLRFSLSHTHGLAACAIVLDRNIGIDVEHISRNGPIDVVNSFSLRERREILGASVETRTRLFLEYWTLKEAYIKARGLGLSLPLDQFSLYKDNGDTWQLASESPPYENPARWRFWSWQVNNDHQLALALDQSEGSLT